MEIPRIALIGGPGSGKTSALEYVRANDPDVYCEKEAMEEVDWEDFLGDINDKTSRDEQANDFRESIKILNRMRRRKTENDAKEQNKKVIIETGYTLPLDETRFKSFMDFDRLLEISYEDQIGKCAVVLFMRTYAGTTNYKPAPDAQYTEEEAVKTNDRLWKLWQPHPKVLEISGTTVETRSKVVSHLISLIKLDRL